MDFQFLAIWVAQGSTDKNWAVYEQLLRAVLSCFYGQIKYSFFLKYCSVRIKKLHNITLKKGEGDKIGYTSEFESVLKPNYFKKQHSSSSFLLP